MKFAAVVFLAVLLLPALSFGDTQINSTKHADTTDPLFWLLQSNAKQGDAKAENLLARVYWSGEASMGVKQDKADSKLWAQKAYESYFPLAEQGDAKAQYEIGHMYDSGQGLDRDSTQAMVWYLRAAAQGNKDAEFAIAAMYRANGGNQGASKDDNKEAMKWYLKAANEGDTRAWFILSWEYYRGQIVKADYEESRFWELLARATEPYNPLPIRINYPSDLWWGKLSDQQLTSVEGRVRNWTLAQANQGYPSAEYALAKLYNNAVLATLKDSAEADKWYRRAADQGYSDAQWHLGWYLKAAQGGSGRAQLRVSKMYRDGEDVKKDYEEAAFWYLLGRETIFEQYEPIFYNGTAPTQYLSPTQIEAVHKRVMDWKPNPAPAETTGKPETK